MDNLDINASYPWEFNEDGWVPEMDEFEPLEVVYKGSEDVLSVEAKNVDWSNVVKWRLVCL